MKKTIKIILTVCCIALVLFLLLPFLETTSPAEKQTVAAAQAEPQIFTSNPLTELVSRIARFFGSKKTANQNSPTQTLTASQANEQFGEPQETALYASAQKPASGTESTSGYTENGAAYMDTYLQNENGEWVLIRQTAPEGASRGMHEINVKDNAYDRYVQQERQARFTPVMRTPKTKEEVPDSKLARVFNPIKRLFGFGENPAATRTIGTDGNLPAGALASSSGLDKNKEKNSILPKNRPIDWNGFDANISAAEPGSVEATKKLADLIMPDAELQRMAEWLADIKYPNAENDPGIQQEKENFMSQWIREKYQQMNQESALIMKEKAQTPEENTLSLMIEDSCENKVVSVKKFVCDLSGQTERPEDYKKTNAAYFYEKTNLNLPPAGVTVVLHKTNQEIPTVESINQTRADEESGPLPQQEEQTIKMYRFMQEKCPDCYWVATGEGQAQELKQTVEAAGLTLKGDPLQRHQQYIQDYLAQQKENGASEEELEKLEQNLRENPTPYTAYTQEDLQKLHQNTLNLMLDRAQPEDASVPFFVQANTANQYYNDTGRKHPMFYGTNTATRDVTLQERSLALTDDVANFVNDWRPIIQEIKREANQEGVTDLSAPRIQEIMEEFKQKQKNFDANNDLGRTQK